MSRKTKRRKSPLGCDVARLDLVVSMKTEAGIAEDFSSFVVVVTKKRITLTCWSRTGGSRACSLGTSCRDIILKGAVGRGSDPSRLCIVLVGGLHMSPIN